MPFPTRPASVTLALGLALSLGLSGCDTAEERAENHYQRGMELLAEGDPDRAFIEFRNVFRLNDAHAPALAEYAAILRARNDLKGAIGHYLRVVELDPQNLAAHRALAEISLQVQDVETASVHAARAAAIAPDDPMVRAVQATVDYRNDTDRAAAVAEAESVLEDAPGNILAGMILIADSLNADDPETALAHVDASLALNPEDEGLHLARLSILEDLERTGETGAQLETMARLFPANEGVRQALVQWHLQQGNTAGAEAVLRDIAAATPDSPGPKLTVVQFLYEMDGPEAAGAELDRLIATEAKPTPYQRARARLDFTEGRADEAIAALEGIIDGAEPSAEIRDLQAALAEMYAATGQEAEAAALVAQVLEGDPNHVAALKMRARSLIAENRPAEAIRDMRTALTRAPRDPEILTIMAQAHEREGARELMGERLALAVEASDHGPDETLRYATFLMGEGRMGPAEAALSDALRRAPGNPDLLAMLGRIHLERQDWTRLGQVVNRLRETGAVGMAGVLETESLAAQGRTGERIALLESLAAGDDGAGAMLELVRTYMASGTPGAATDYLSGVIAENPNDIQATVLLAQVHAAAGTPGEAETLYRDLTARMPENAEITGQFFQFLTAEGRMEEAEEVLNAGIDAASDPSELLLMRAGLLEARGDISGATEIYEKLHAENPGSLILANNLASLLAGSGGETASLERAYEIATVLEGSHVPWFQDTWGWILHLRGETQEAIDYLKPAAAALPGNALVQFHLGEVEFALERWPDARKSFARAQAAAGAGDPLPEADAALLEDRVAEITTLETTPAGN